jgi:hypothetical protein
MADFNNIIGWIVFNIIYAQMFMDKSSFLDCDDEDDFCVLAACVIEKNIIKALLKIFKG